jgi:hypothetical protein
MQQLKGKSSKKKKMCKGNGKYLIRDQRELIVCSAHFHDETPPYQATTLQHVGREISTSKESSTIANIFILAADSL